MPISRITGLGIALGALALMLPLVAGNASASELRYRPINPSFGGDPFNSSHLLGTAEAQNDNVKPEKPFDPMADFENTVTSSLISRLSRDLADSILGENAQDSGTAHVGSTDIVWKKEGGTIVVTLTGGGKQTTVKIPAPTF